mmetsp:Transcript_3871/g.4710  ORF Transcript_3871/g.4710 Transcript_3871/m.4710 type:complete len:335 (+) Transcript_3871:217-1221(+)
MASRRNTGVIRPRQFVTRTTNGGYKDFSKQHSTGLLSKKHLTVLLGLAVTLVAFYFLQGFTGLNSKVQVASDSRSSSSIVDDVDDVPETTNTLEFTDDESEEDETEENELSQDEETEEGTETQTEDEEDTIIDTVENTVSEGENDSEDDGSTEDQTFEESSSDDSKDAYPRRKRLRRPNDKIQLSIDSILHNAGRKAVTIDSTGSYKYVLIEATDFRGDKTLMVQGCPVELGNKCKHPVAAQIIGDALKQYGMEIKVLGGGRITRHGLKKAKRKEGLISIFGYSKSFGRCDDCNERACALVAAAFPDYVVRWSNQGYTEKDEYRYKHDFTKCSS